jgi:hypothetical protein
LASSRSGSARIAGIATLEMRDIVLFGTEDGGEVVGLAVVMTMTNCNYGSEVGELASP